MRGERQGERRKENGEGERHRVKGRGEKEWEKEGKKMKERG